jgi:hypothetical protein
LTRWIVLAIAVLLIMAQRPEDVLLSACIEREQCGYIDSEGKVVIEPRFEAAGDWVRDIGRVWQNGLVGSIDRNGRFITTPKYPKLSFNAGGGYSVPVGDKQLLTDYALRPLNNELWDDLKGIKLDRHVRQDPDYIVVERDGLMGLADGKGRVIVPPRYEEIGWRGHEFPLLFKERGLFGHMNETGAPIGVQRWSEAGMFYNKLAYVARDGKCGYIDRIGILVIPLIFDECRNFWNADAAIVRRDSTFALIDRTGRIVKDGFDEAAIPAEDDNPIAVRVQTKWGAVDAKGAYRIEPIFDALDPLDIIGWLLPTVSIGRTTVGYRAKVDGKFGLLATDGTWILQPVHDQIDADYNGDGKLAVFRIGTKWGFVDVETRKSTPPNWDEVKSTRRAALIPVRIDTKWGYGDQDGRTVIAARFDELGYFFGDWAAVRTGDKWGFIDDQGEQITPPVFRTVYDTAPERARVLLVESRGWVTRKGRLMGISEEDLKRAGLKR